LKVVIDPALASCGLLLLPKSTLGLRIDVGLNRDQLALGRGKVEQEKEEGSEKKAPHVTASEG
jgi:hypothetical protein